MTDKAIKAALEAHANSPDIVDYDTAYNAMRSAIAAYEQAMWRPIEEAPMDAPEDVILHYEGRVPVVAAWFYGGWAPFDLEGKHIRKGEPTHYRPLPPPPGKEG